MRISDWSSDVCSSDLAAGFFVSGFFADSSALIANGVDNLSDTAVYALSLVALTRGQTWKTRAAVASGVMLLIFAGGILIDVGRRYLQGSEPIGPTMMVMSAIAGVVNYLCLRRSEEHTSELQSLMRISYAVFCLKKNTTQHT